MTPYTKQTIINGHTVALMPEAGSASIAAYAAAYADPPAKFNGKLLRDDFDRVLAGKRFWHKECPVAENPEEVVSLVRHPVERIESWLTQFQLSADEVLDSVESGGIYAKDKHAQKAEVFLGGTNYLFRYPNHITEFENYLGIEDGLPKINASGEDLIKLTPEQLERVKALYADDIALYESITEPGQVLEIPAPEPEPDPPRPLGTRLKEKMAAQPLEIRAAFAPEWAGMKVLLEEQDFEAARYLVEHKEVGPELEQVQQEFLAEFDK